MSTVVELENILLLVLAAVIPAVIYLTWVRTTEQGQREGWGVILNAFLWGAFFATVIAALIEAVLVAAGASISQATPAPEFFFLNPNSSAGTLFLILVIAPFVEEGLKAAGVINYREAIRTVADGPVVGASVGLGFGFFETFLYGFAAFLTGGLAAGITLIVVRSVSSVLLHGSSAAFFGYGYASERTGAAGPGAGAHYLGAVGLHAGFNAVVSLGTFGMMFGLTGDLVTALDWVGLAGGILLAFAAIEYVRSLIVQSSFPGALAAHPKYRPPVPKAPAPARSPPRR